MCGPNERAPMQEKPEVTLARRIKMDLGPEIAPQALRLFILARWDTVSLLAHKIHGSSGENWYSPGGVTHVADPYDYYRQYK